jgi:hypothetical protein
MAKLKEYLFKHNETMRGWQDPVSEIRAMKLRNSARHQWAEDMPDLEGKALADAEKQFDYDSWLGEHGIGE